MRTQLSFFGEPSSKVLEDETYIISIFELPNATRLSIQRKDGAGGITWDELQRLKNECGFAEHDAVEVYPRSFDVHYTTEMRHLWISPDLLPHVWRRWY